jgi:serine protease AprX
MSTTDLASSPRVRRLSRSCVRALVFTLIGLIACPQIARAQLLPPGALGGLLDPVSNLLGPLDPLLGPILDPILDPLLGPGGLLNEHKLDAALRNWSRNGTSSTARVIVTTTAGQAGLVGALVGLLGGLLQGLLPSVNALVAEVSHITLAALLLDPRVTSISLDTPVLAIDGNLVAPRDGANDDDAPLREAMGLAATTPAANGIGVAIIDSGISPTVDFLGRISAFYDFTRGGIATTPVDPYGHGTHIAGIIGSSGVSSADGQYRGLGHRARLIGLRVLDEQGRGETSQVIKAIEFATAQKNALGIHVINLSLGHPIYEPAATDPLVRAVERAVAAGIVVVASAGNFGYNRVVGSTGYAGITSPGNAPSAITVGALRAAGTVSRADDDVAPYSSRGPSWYDGFAKPDLLAPGHGIVSTSVSNSGLYEAYPSVRAGEAHMRLNGTSMATATATGVVALMLESHRQAHLFGPPIAPNAIKAILQYTATPLDERAGATNGGVTPDALTQGAGSINAPAAIAAARALDASRPVGTDWLSGTLSPVTTYADEAWPWAATVTWRDTLLGGAMLVEFRRSAWGLATPWGQPLEWAADVTTGPNVVWNQSINWAGNIVWGTQLVGTADSTDGTTFTWGEVEDPSNTVWGNLGTRTTNGQTFCWGDTQVPPASQP